MKRMTHIAAVIIPAALLSLPVAGAADAPEEVAVPGQSNCTDASDHGAYRTCLEQQAKARAVVVREAEQRVFDAIARWEEKAQARQNARALFDASRQMFQAHRTATCEVAASIAAGGNSASDLRLKCQEELDLEWLAYLQDLTGRFTP